MKYSNIFGKTTIGRTMENILYFAMHGTAMGMVKCIGRSKDRYASMAHPNIALFFQRYG